MKIKTESQIFLAVILLSVLLILDIVFTKSLMQSAELNDVERITRNLQRVVVALNMGSRNLSSVAGNLACSDKAWDFAAGKDPSYPSVYLNRNILTDIGISSLIFLDNDLNVIYKRDYSAEDDGSSPESEIAVLLNDKGREFLKDLPEDGVSGIVMKGDAPLFFAVKYITRSDMGGDRVGYLIATEILSPKMILRISTNLGFSFAVTPVTNKEAASELPNLVIKNAEDSSFIRGEHLMRDYEGAPAFWISGIAPNINTEKAERQLDIVFAILAVCSLAVVWVFGRFMNSRVTKRLKKLQHEVEVIRDEAPEDHHITVDKNKDEITSLERTLSDYSAFANFRRGEKAKSDNITLDVYKRFAKKGETLFKQSIDEIAIGIAPGDERFRTAMTRAAQAARDFAAEYKLVPDDELYYLYLGALFSRVGMNSLPLSLRNKDLGDMSRDEAAEFKSYPEKSKEFMDSVELLRPAEPLVYCWNENWDGTGFPRGLSGSEIPVEARIFAIADEWNELTRPWLGRRIPSREKTADKLREKAGTRFDPVLVEKFILFLDKAGK